MVSHTEESVVYHYFISGIPDRRSRHSWVSMPFNSYIKECSGMRLTTLEKHLKQLRKLLETEETTQATTFYQDILEKMSDDEDSYLNVCIGCDCYEEIRDAERYWCEAP